MNKVGADVVLLHGCPQSCMPNPVEGLLEVYEDTVKVLLVLEIFLTYSAWVEDLGHIMMYQLFQGHASWATSHCTVYFRGMSLTGPYHDVLYISGACLFLCYITMYCIFQEYVYCCGLDSLCFRGWATS